MNMDAWLEQAWNRHADEPAGVLDDIGRVAADAAGNDAEVGRLLHLVQHIAGSHQGAPAELAAGRALLRQLAALPAAGPGAQASAALYDRALALTGGDEHAASALPAAEAIRVAALSAAHLAERDTARAGRLLADACAAAERAALPDTDPAVRALAVAGNNIAATLEEQPKRDAAADALMLQAAEIGLRFWRRAGTWLEEERAHHRLARCAAAAGDAVQALGHARACLAIVEREGADALEVFFAHEALARAHAAAGDTDARALAVRHAAQTFARLSPDDQSWCRETLENLGPPLP